MLAYAQGRGMEMATLAQRFSLDPDHLADPDARVDAAVVQRLWEKLPRMLGDPDFGVHLARFAAAGGPSMLIEWMMQSSCTLREGIDRALRYERVLQDVSTTEMRKTPEGVVLAVPEHGNGIRPPRVALEYMFSWVVLFARRITGAPVVPAAVAFEGPRPANMDALQQTLGCVPTFGARTSSVALDHQTLALATLSPDASLQGFLQRHADATLQHLRDDGSIRARVLAVVRSMLPSGACTLSALAGALQMSTRTLQRRLAAQHTSLVEVVDGVRRTEAARLLSSSTESVAAIAFALGFSSQGSFHRAFVRWYGVPPGTYRRRAHAAPPDAAI